MFMHKKVVELKEIVELKDKQAREIRDWRWKLEKAESDYRVQVGRMEERHGFDIEKAKDEVRKEMQKDLITSDLKRVEAVAKLNTYIGMDTKEERKHIAKMLEKAIESLGKQQVVVQK